MANSDCAGCRWQRLVWLFYFYAAHVMGKTINMRVDATGQIGTEGLDAWNPRRVQEAIEILNGSGWQAIRMDPRDSGSLADASEHVVLRTAARYRMKTTPS
ncbi:unnamed protein product [Symbiodinium pilosum]|uniref:Uncharacterized protein n=1 Tax=Symbiodinium pilosum TaxID=2952 RepID=A0A812V5S8_SYMPI|nr:unnamed protein product [Symbiodinium pilosum]